MISQAEELCSDFLPRSSSSRRTSSPVSAGRTLRTGIRAIPRASPKHLAHSKPFSEKAYALVNEPKELYSVPDAEHIDLYDQVDKIPFDKLESFFKENM